MNLDIVGSPRRLSGVFCSLPSTANRSTAKAGQLIDMPVVNAYGMEVLAAGKHKASAWGAKLGRPHSKPRQIPPGRHVSSPEHQGCTCSGAAAGHGAHCVICCRRHAVSTGQPPVWDSFSECWEVSWGRSPPRWKRPPHLLGGSAHSRE